MEQPRQRPTRKFIVGLGNPGRDYRRTRHNVGFIVVDALAQRWGADKPKVKFDATICSARPPGTDVEAVLVEPITYMNLSGRAVGQVLRYHDAGRHDVLIVMDDLALPLGRLRFREKGSAGGHKGLADIIRHVGADVSDECLPRLRIGIGPLPPEADATEFVLKKFAKSEMKTMERAIEQAEEAVEDWLIHGIKYVMNRYNARETCGEGE